MQKTMSSHPNRELIAFARSPSNDGLSVWVAQGRHHQMSLMHSKPRGIPKLNCHHVYMMLDQRHDNSVLGDGAYTYFKAYFWIGARALDHQVKVENTIAVLDQIVEAHPMGSAKIRVFIENQYAESLYFFTLFGRLDQPTTTSAKITSNHAIQY